MKVSDNERIILDTVRRNEPILRSTIHAQLPLTQPSVHRILNTLVSKQLLTVGEAKAKGPGKPSPQIWLNRSSYYSVGISVNTDAITVCLTNLACEPLQTITLEGIAQNREKALQRIYEVVSDMLKTEGIGEEALVGICLAISGFLTSRQNQISTPQPLADWSLIDLHQALRNYFHSTPISIANNATTGAIGESLTGAGRWANSFAYLSFNYGFGGGLIIDGKPYIGGHGNALEISGIYNEEELAMRPALGILIDVLNSHGINIKTVEELQNRFDPNWPGVEAWVEQATPMLNRALWAIRSVIDPELLVFGGQIPKALAEMFFERLSIHAVEHHRYGVEIPTPRLIYTESSDVGPALGAAMLSLKAQFF